MDPITTAIVAALVAGISSGATDVGKKVIADAYEALKTSLIKKYGAKSKITRAITELESEPDYKPNQDALAGRVAQVKAADNHELKELAQTLIIALKSTSEGKKALSKYHVDAAGSQIGIIGDDANVQGGIHFGKPKK